jgi:hypothetical protein
MKETYTKPTLEQQDQLQEVVGMPPPPSGVVDD